MKTFTSMLITCLMTGGMLLGPMELFGKDTKGEKLTDEEISRAVKREIQHDLGLHEMEKDIKATTASGIVTLKGEVNNLLAKERAERLAATVRGVRSVVNLIEVDLDSPKKSKELAQDIVGALASDPATEAYEITVDVSKEGMVTLKGKVDSWAERSLSEKVAKSVKGVKGVENRIRVQYSDKRPDSEIKADVERMLRWDMWVDQGLIEVSVDNGQVRLSGIVGSLAEKSRAIVNSLVAGVKGINTEDLKVERWFRDKDLRKNKYRDVSDGDILKAVTNTLLFDPRVSAFNIVPEVNSGVVSLKGTVDNLKALRAAGQDARNVVGVVDVKNLIQVDAGKWKKVGDKKVKENVQSSLRRDPYLDKEKISVSILDGIVQLTGTVDTFFERAHADDVVARVIGVKAVDNDLEVRNMGTPLTYDPYIYDWAIYDYDWYKFDPKKVSRKDREIQEEIRQELFWSPFVDANQVKVSVKDGVATLKGEVDSWMESRAAVENAFEGGAIGVKNQIEVQ